MSEACDIPDKCQKNDRLRWAMPLKLKWSTHQKRLQARVTVRYEAPVIVRRVEVVHRRDGSLWKFRKKKVLKTRSSVTSVLPELESEPKMQSRIFNACHVNSVLTFSEEGDSLILLDDKWFLIATSIPQPFSWILSHLHITSLNLYTCLTQKKTCSFKDK